MRSYTHQHSVRSVPFNLVIHFALGRPCPSLSKLSIITEEHKYIYRVFEVAGSVFSGGCCHWLSQHLSYLFGSQTVCSCLTFKCQFLTNSDCSSTSLWSQKQHWHVINQMVSEGFIQKLLCSHLRRYILCLEENKTLHKQTRLFIQNTQLTTHTQMQFR